MGKYLVVFIIGLFAAKKSYCQDTSASDKGSVYIDSIMKSKTANTINKDFPQFTVKFGNQVISNKTLLGKKVFINFWFENCAPCVAEFKPLNEMYKKLKKKKNFVFVAFTFENEETVKAIRKKYGITYPVISIARKECYRLNQQNGFPTNFIVDKLGKISYMKTGGSVDEENAQEYIFKILYPEIIKLQ